MYFTKIYIFIFLIINNIAAQEGFSVHVLSEKDLEHFSVVQVSMNHTGTDACINKVTDGKNTYILKQIADPSVEEQLLLVTDAICSTIGTSCDIQVNQVSFIPYNVGIHLKIYPDQAATLHTYVSGTDLESAMPKKLADKDFTIHQRIIKKDSPWQQKYPLAENRQGLVQEIIENMSINETLPPMVAFDTFVGNADRSLPNIFYDVSTNSFCGIDHAAGLHSNLAGVSCQRVKELIADGYFKTCSLEIKHGLHIYKNTLKKLVDSAKPIMIAKMFDDLAKHLSSDALSNQDVLEDIKCFSDVFRKNVDDVRVLISLLERVIKN